MEPTTKELNVEKGLIKIVTVNGKTLSKINVKRMIIRPIMKRIVFITEEFDRVIVYEGEEEFEAHKSDSDEVLMTALIEKIDSLYTV